MGPVYPVGYTNKSRATGRTFRAILGVLLAASEGNKVVFIGSTESDAASKRIVYKRLIQKYFGSSSDKFIPSDPYSNLFVFPNGGGIKFVGIEKTQGRESNLD